MHCGMMFPSHACAHLSVDLPKTIYILFREDPESFCTARLIDLGEGRKAKKSRKSFPGVQFYSRLISHHKFYAPADDMIGAAFAMYASLFFNFWVIVYL
ncbi:hypothetical protein LIER_39443 [Lithospermum erythrorhizon]|uniref:Uncharacterized protein n=1 Tax=Lithospermum erythrorhizon TaxID=34254 RepID=A0AAV3QGI2_LITER